MHHPSDDNAPIITAREATRDVLHLRRQEYRLMKRTDAAESRMTLNEAVVTAWPTLPEAGRASWRGRNVKTRLTPSAAADTNFDA